VQTWFQHTQWYPGAERITVGEIKELREPAFPWQMKEIDIANRVLKDLQQN